MNLGSRCFKGGKDTVADRLRPKRTLASDTATIGETEGIQFMFLEPLPSDIAEGPIDEGRECLLARIVPERY